jgi:hypothetical protein
MPDDVMTTRRLVVVFGGLGLVPFETSLLRDGFGGRMGLVVQLFAVVPLAIWTTFGNCGLAGS